MKCIIGTKQGMTQIFKEDGTVVPVTRVQAGPCTVTQVKTKEKDGVNSIQVGYGEQKTFRQPRAQQGHLSGLPSVRVMKEFRTSEADAHLARGTTFTVATFAPGDKIKVTGVSKGKGFQGVVKRHGFHGQDVGHGNKDQERMPGSIGAGGVQHVFKGTRMGGRMGTDQVTISNLEVISVNIETNELYIKGAVPGARGGYLYIYTNDGTIEPTAEEAVLEETTTSEEVVAETSTTDSTTADVATEEVVTAETDVADATQVTDTDVTPEEKQA
jgi:large subunit ribosomal protein L3